MAGVRIGCDHLVYAPLKKDDGTTLEYEDVVALPKVMKININPNPSNQVVSLTIPTRIEQTSIRTTQSYFFCN